MPVSLAPVWVVPRCGTCGKAYTVNARTAPQIGAKLYCRKCWDRGMRLRHLLDMVVYEVPAGTWPDPTSDDPTRRGDGAVPLRKGAKLL